MSAQERATITPEYSNTAESLANSRHRFMFAVARLAALPYVWVVLFTLAGLAARLYRLDARSLWADEVSFSWPVRLNSPVDVLSMSSQYDDQSPLSFFLTWLLRSLGGSESVVRMPFVVTGALCIPAIYLLGRELARPRVALVAALLFSLSPFAVFYSQEAHPYSPLLLFTTLQALFAYRADRRGRIYDWAIFALLSILNLYNDFIGLIVFVTLGLFIIAALLGKRLGILQEKSAQGEKQGDEASPAPPPAVRFSLGKQLLFALLTFAIVTLAYLPEVPRLLTFVRDPLIATNRVADVQPDTFSYIRAIEHDLGFNKFFLALLFIGSIYMLVTLVRERRLSSLMLAMWVILPLLAFWLRLGDGMFVLKAPYFSFLFPAALILIALGIDWAVQYANRLYRLWREGRPRTDRTPSFKWLLPVLYGVMLLLVLIQTSTALASSYSTPKFMPQDYRGAVDKIIAESPPDSTVLLIERWGIKPAPSFNKLAGIDGIAYYLWLRHSPIAYLDSSLLDASTAASIASRGQDTVIWGMIPSTVRTPIAAEELQRATDLGIEVTQYYDFTLVRQRAPRGTPAQQTDTLLEWASGIEPGLIAVRAMLNPQFETSAMGDNLLPPAQDVQIPSHPGSVLNGEEQPDKWPLWSGVTLSPDSRSFVLSSDGSRPMVDLTLSTRKLVPGTTYVLLFHYRNIDLKGEQRVYLSVYGDNNQLLDTFPYGDGFLCPPNADSESAFAFTVPKAATGALLWLRVTGSGTAEYSSVELRPVK